ncbi:MAG: hypothetical protein ACLQBY_07970 [Solirubrobacteraceae bacterium]
MVLVEPAAIDLDDHLRSGTVERGALELLERIAPDIAVHVLGAGQALESRERGLVRGAAGAHDQAAEAGCTRGARGERSRAAAHGHGRTDAAAHLDLSIEQNRALVVWLCERETHDLDGAGRKLKPQLAIGIFQNGPDLDELRDQCAKAAVGRQSLERERHRHARARSLA